MKIKITCNTPKGQAEKSVKTQKATLLGLGLARKVKEQKVVSDTQFYWILDIEPKELGKVTKKVIKGETIIRKFYSVLIKNINRVNIIGTKTGKGINWIKKQLIKRLKKQFEHSDSDEMIKNLESMNDEETHEYIKIHDKEAMQKFLKKDLIILEELE